MAVLRSDVPVTRLRLTGASADAAHIAVDGVGCGWCLGSDWSFVPPEPLAAGRHQVAVRLIPSNFNRYGPHHHIDGDPSVVSPAQYEYARNFADRPDAPAVTRTRAWHLKPFGIGGLAME